MLQKAATLFSTHVIPGAMILGVYILKIDERRHEMERFIVLPSSEVRNLFIDDSDFLCGIFSAEEHLAVLKICVQVNLEVILDAGATL
jgi:hypothetical protein